MGDKMLSQYFSNSGDSFFINKQLSSTGIHNSYVCNVKNNNLEYFNYYIGKQFEILKISKNKKQLL